MAGGFPAQDRRHRRHPCLRSLDVAGSHRGDRRAHQRAERRCHRHARRLRRRPSPRHALHSGQRMGAGARRTEGAARRARDHGQSRLLGRQDGAAPGARADGGPPRAGGSRHSRLRERRRASDQGRPPVLARRARRSTGLSSGAALSQIARIGADDLARTLAKVTDDAPVILLAHEPDIALRVPSRVALQLSGHTHGGQVRLLGWSPAVPPKHGVRLAYGHLRLKCDVIISGGLGCSIMPFRVGVPPEIVLVTLARRGRRWRNWDGWHGSEHQMMIYLMSRSWSDENHNCDR